MHTGLSSRDLRRNQASPGTDEAKSGRDDSGAPGRRLCATGRAARRTTILAANMAGASRSGAQGGLAVLVRTGHQFDVTA